MACAWRRLQGLPVPRSSSGILAAWDDASGLWMLLTGRTIDALTAGRAVPGSSTGMNKDSYAVVGGQTGLASCRWTLGRRGPDSRPHVHYDNGLVQMFSLR